MKTAQNVWGLMLSKKMRNFAALLFSATRESGSWNHKAERVLT